MDDTAIAPPDGFPALSSDPDFRIQLQISEDLQNARELEEAFEEEYPQEERGKSISFLAVQRAPPSRAALFPNVAKAKPNDWLTPMLRRLRWQTDQGDGVRYSRDHLATMVGMLMREMSRLTEEQFIELARHADCFWMPTAFDYLLRMEEFVRTLERRGPLSDAVTLAMRRIFECSRQIFANSNLWESLVWPLFRSRTGFYPFDPCWAPRCAATWKPSTPTCAKRLPRCSTNSSIGRRTPPSPWYATDAFNGPANR
jgi:hypothetical protein